MKKKQINKVKVNIFEEKELRENFLLNKEQINLILNYQEQFPELLQVHKDNEFIIDTRKLWENLNQPQGIFANFIKRDLVSIYFKEKGKNTKETKYKENIDYIIKYKIPKKFDEHKIENVRNMNRKQLSRYGISIEYYLTVNCAKKISMQQGNKIGDIIQDYFILIEETLRNYKEWYIGRELEKSGWNEMKKNIKEWCERNKYDCTLDIFYIREANLLNESLLGFKASEINSMLNNDDITRNHLCREVNLALQNLQMLNSALLINNLDFQTRSNIIKNTCENKYSDLKELFNKLVA